MPARLAKTKKHRQKKAAKLGNSSKRARENKGTTASFPLTGALPSLRYGVAVKADDIVVATAKLKKPATAAAKKPAASKQASK